VNLNKSLSDELNQGTSFPTACSNKKYLKKPNKTQKPSGFGFFEKIQVFLNAADHSCQDA